MKQGRCLGFLLPWLLVSPYCKTGPQTADLFRAIGTGNNAGAEVALQAGAEVNARAGPLFSTPLMLAAQKGHARIVRALIARGADCSATDRSGHGAIAYAALGGRNQIFQAIAACTKSTPTGKSENAQFLLFMAAEGGNAAIFRRVLLELRAGDAKAKGRFGNTILHSAALGGNGTIVNLAVEAGAQVNERNEAGETALLRAAFYGRTAVVIALLSQKADPGIKDNRGVLPVAYAEERSHTGIAKLLSGSPPELTGELLHRAAYLGDTVIIRLAAASKFKVDERSTAEAGYTALMLAAGADQPDVVQLLIDAGADANAPNVLVRKTPLMYAAEEGSAASVRLLISAKANVAAETTGNETALHFAVRENHADIVKLLLDAGAKPDVKFSTGLSLLEYARSARQTEVARLLEGRAP